MYSGSEPEEPEDLTVSLPEHCEGPVRADLSASGHLQEEEEGEEEKEDDEETTKTTNTACNNIHCQTLILTMLNLLAPTW